ncbi:MAG: O-antigen ligase family protein [Eubacterium sp.]
MLLYHVLLILITILGDAGISDGLKKMFMFPCACLLCDAWMRKNPHILLKTVMDIMFIEEVLNMLLWNVKAFGGTNFLLGIRTDFPMVGFLAVFVALMCINLKLPKTKYRAYITIALAAASILRAWVSTGVAALLVFAVFFVFITRKKFAKTITARICSNKILIPVGVFLNIAIVFFKWQDKFEKYITQYLGETMTLNGRTFIWEQAINAFHDSPIWGYGAYGYYVETFWTKLNYVHNQMLQLFLDGGLVLAIVFLVWLVIIGLSIGKCKDEYIRQIATAVLFANLLIMIAEAPTAYSVFFILITIMAHTDQLVMLKEKFARRDMSGVYR